MTDTQAFDEISSRSAAELAEKYVALWNEPDPDRRRRMIAELWAGSEGLSFRGRDDVERLGDVVKFHWEAVAQDGETFAVGLNFLVLAADGRIERDYTFVVA